MTVIIDEFPDYEIDTDGVVTKIADGFRPKTSNHCEGYRQIKLRLDGKQYSRLIHRLLAKAFIPNPDDLPMIDHIDGDRSNNALSNLHWVTDKQNSHNRKKAKGYYFHKRIGKWVAQIMEDGKGRHLGYFDTEAEAKTAYDAAVNERNARSGAVLRVIAA